MRRFSIELLKESPSNALRACASLASVYQPLAKDLFNAAFVSCWTELYDQYQEELVRSLEIATSIGHQETWIKVTAEREFLRLLDGGCHTPVGVYSHLTGSQIHLHARVFPESGGQPKIGSATDTDPIQAALKLFQSLK